MSQPDLFTLTAEDLAPKAPAPVQAPKPQPEAPKAPEAKPARAVGPLPISPEENHTTQPGLAAGSFWHIYRKAR